MPLSVFSRAEHNARAVCLVLNRYMSLGTSYELPVGGSQLASLGSENDAFQASLPALQIHSLAGCIAEHSDNFAVCRMEALYSK